MAKRQGADKFTPGSNEEVIRLLAILAKRGMTQTALVYELADRGFAPKRIAELVGTAPNTVSVLLHQRNKKAGKRTGQRRAPSPGEVVATPVSR